jgi:hypothetical protein
LATTTWVCAGRRLKGVVEATTAGAIVTVVGFFDDAAVGPIVAALAAVRYGIGLGVRSA